MPLPDYKAIMLPLLQFAQDGNEHSLAEAIGPLSNHFNLTEAELSQLLPSGVQLVFHSRVTWANTYLKKAELLESTGRARFRITERGIELLKANPKAIDEADLLQSPEFVAFKKGKSGRAVKQASTRMPGFDQNVLAPPKPNLPANGRVQRTPVEEMEQGYLRIRQELALELLSAVKRNAPEFFERLVVELLVKMGYGGSRRDAGLAVGKSRDGGIDGIIKEDRLGLDVVYIQAKRWDASVGAPEIQKFVGALHGHGARKGVFLTTAKFTHEATEYAKKVDTKVVLIDGEQLAQYMIDFDVGVAKSAVYEIKKLDLDYFAAT